MRILFAGVCALSGAAAVVAGVALWSQPAALILAGAGLIYTARVAASKPPGDDANAS